MRLLPFSLCSEALYRLGETDSGRGVFVLQLDDLAAANPLFSAAIRLLWLRQPCANTTLQECWRRLSPGHRLLRLSLGLGEPYPANELEPMLACDMLRALRQDSHAISVAHSTSLGEVDVHTR